MQKQARICLLAGLIAVSNVAVGFQSPAASGSLSPPSPVAATGTGKVEGTVENGIVAYRNIPYASAPIGDLRWRAPQPPAPWTGIRPATDYGAICPQPNHPARPARTEMVQSEDCLNLNVWAPAGASNLPVMVWIHGGAHIMGSGNFPFYDGSALADDGVVVVTLNYRVGLLGYFAHPALTSEADPETPLGNYGLMDQVLALEWVRDNIASFGGDPDNVTVFGQSAGGLSIHYLLTLDRTSGLFHKAIIQSGGGWRNSPTLAEMEQLGISFAAAADLREDTDVAGLRALDSAKILALQPTLTGPEFGPLIDGRLVETEPWRAFAAGDAHDVPLIVGANSNEASVLRQMSVSGQTLRAFLGDERVASLHALYADTAPDEEEFNRQLLGDVFFVAPARWSAKQLQGGAPVFLYHFDYVAKRLRGRLPGANHSSEVPYVFGTWDKLGRLAQLLAEDDRGFALELSRCWTSFAKTGAPNCFATEWPSYRIEDDQAMVFAETAGIVQGYNAGRLDELEAIRVERNQGVRR